MQWESEMGRVNLNNKTVLHCSNSANITFSWLREAYIMILLQGMVRNKKGNCYFLLFFFLSFSFFILHHKQRQCVWSRPATWGIWPENTYIHRLDLFNQLFTHMMTQLISTQMNVQLAFCVAHICSGTLVLSWPSDTIPVLCYTCNTSTDRKSVV